MGLSDKQLDSLVRLALQTQTVVTARQKDTARERLLREAAMQKMLVPYAMPPVAPQPVPGWPERVLSGIRHTLHLLLFEEHRYQRAANNRHFMPITSIMGVSIVIHFYPPARYQPR